MVSVDDSHSFVPAGLAAFPSFFIPFLCRSMFFFDFIRLLLSQKKHGKLGRRDLCFFLSFSPVRRAHVGRRNPLSCLLHLHHCLFCQRRDLLVLILKFAINAVAPILSFLSPSFSGAAASRLHLFIAMGHPSISCQFFAFVGKA